jgi:hypothetical protein
MERIIEPNSFARFFNRCFYTEDRGYTRMKLLTEMAQFGYIVKDPIKFDRDDIAFLKQFPRKYWLQAMYARYHDDLIAALEEREEHRRPIFDAVFNRLYENVYLPHYLSEEKNEKVAHKKAARRAQIVAEKIAEGRARSTYVNGNPELPEIDEIWDQIKDIPGAETGVPNTTFPEKKIYTFRKTGGTKAAPNLVHIMADTGMNKLIHKLETDPAQMHHPESGLAGPGRYGYDLWGPRRSRSEGTHSATRGMNIPKYHTIKERLSEWLNYIGHHMLGELPNDPNAWKPDSAGSATVEDSFTTDRYRKEYEKYYERLIPMDPRSIQNWQRFFPDDTKTVASELGAEGNQSKIRKLAARMAWEHVERMAQAGKLRTPPNPKHPQGRPVEYDPERKEIRRPQLFLPHENTVVHYVDKDGNPLKDETTSIPVLRPGKFLKKIDPGEEVDDSLRLGKHWNPETGEWESNYMEVPRSPQGSDAIRAGGIHPNQNTVGRKYLDPTDDNYGPRLEKLEQLMGRGTVDDDFQWRPVKGGGGSFFRDIVEAINGTLDSREGGKMIVNTRPYEIATLKAIRPSLHNYAYMNLAENLNDPAILDESARGRTARKEKVAIIVKNFAQQDWGRGTRRLRGSKADVQIGQALPEGEGSLATVLDEVLTRARENQKALKDKACDVRTQGQHVLNTGYCQFQYDLRTLWEMLDTAEQDAAESEREQQSAFRMDDARLAGEAVSGMRDALAKAFAALSAMYENEGKDKKTADELAHQDIIELSHEDKTPGELIKKVKRRVQAMAKRAGVPAAEMQLPGAEPDHEADAEEQAHAKGIWDDAVATVLQGAENPNVLLQNMTPDRINAFQDMARKHPFLEPSLEKLMRQYDTAKRSVAQQQAQGQPAVTPTTQLPQGAPPPKNIDQLEDLARNEQWVLIGISPRFQRRASKEQIEMLIQRIQAQISKGVFKTPLEQRWAPRVVSILQALPKMKV